VSDTVYITSSYQATKDIAGAVEGILIHAVDVTEPVMARNRLEARVLERTAELLEAEQKLRTLNNRLLQAQDDERRRLARDLHDSAGQILVALKMNLYSLEQVLRKKDAELDKVAVSSVKLVDDLSTELRTISHLLHPPLLDEAGLASALRWYAEGFEERSKIAVALHLDRNVPRLPQEIETAIFRIVQESLTNIHRHSGSESAAISLQYAHGDIRVEVQDCGRGIAQFDAARKMPVRAGVGVQGMQERVRQLGGQFEITSSPKGTTVMVALPHP
jgi:signal transduction histidine kinase